MAKVGRPSTFTKAKGEEVCRLLMDGMSVRKICALDGMPNQTTIYDWLLKDDEFAKQYARAREVQADRLFEEILDISDDSANDKIIDDEGNERTDHEVVARSRLRVDARKWMAGKLAPKKYSDKLMVAGDQENPIQHRHVHAMTEEQLERIASGSG